MLDIRQVVPRQAWAKCIRIHKYSNKFVEVFITLDMLDIRQVVPRQAWAKCIRIHKYSNTFFKVFIFVFEYFCEKCKVFVFVFKYISKVFVFMNTFMNILNIFHFLLIFFHPVLTSFRYKYEIWLSIIMCLRKLTRHLINTFSQ